jgi:hypothetical protein
LRPHRDGRILAGLDYPKEIEPIDIDDYDPALDENTRGKIQKGLLRRIPQLHNAPFDHGWGSIYTITDDWHPVVGAEPGIQGYYACFGGSGHGFKLGPPLGESLAEIITGGTSKIDISALSPTRFAEGELFTSAWGAGNRGWVDSNLENGKLAPMQQILFPQLNDAGDGGQVSEVLVEIGEAIETGDAVVSVEMEKSIVEVESPHAGTVATIHVTEGDEVEVGQLLMELE